jgi:RNA polymerase sigma-70 factor (ECF subfamily)
LNRAIAIAQLKGPECGLAAIRSIDGLEKLERYPFLPAALGELESRLGRVDQAREHFARASDLARNAAERRFFDHRARTC